MRAAPPRPLNPVSPVHAAIISIRGPGCGVFPELLGARMRSRPTIARIPAAAALPKLNKAVTLHPEEPKPHSLLAEAYGQLGQKAEGDRERGEAERLGASVQGQPVRVDPQTQKKDGRD